MNTDKNLHKTSNFAVLSISFEKADAETRGKFAFFYENIKNYLALWLRADSRFTDVKVESTIKGTGIFSKKCTKKTPRPI